MSGEPLDTMKEAPALQMVSMLADMEMDSASMEMDSVAVAWCYCLWRTTCGRSPRIPWEAPWGGTRLFGVPFPGTVLRVYSVNATGVQCLSYRSCNALLWGQPMAVAAIRAMVVAAIRAMVAATRAMVVVASRLIVVAAARSIVAAALAMVASLVVVAPPLAGCFGGTGRTSETSKKEKECVTKKAAEMIKRAEDTHPNKRRKTAEGL